MKAGVDDSSTHVLLIIFQHWEASTDKKRRGPACHTALSPPLAETLPDDDSFLPPPCAWGCWAGAGRAREVQRCVEHRNHRHRLRVERAFSLRGVHFCKPANVLCPTSNPTPGPSISGWINICSSQLSERSPGPPVVHIFRHCGNVLLDLYIPTPNGSIRQL